MTEPDDPTTLVSTEWLAQHLGDPDLRVLDASWHMPATGRDGRAEYDRQHIPGARFFDIDEIADLTRDLPHMAPPPEKFIARVRALGVGDGQQVVVYDSLGIFSAARVWWTFRLMGKSRIAVLDGGLLKWLAEGRPVTDATPAIRERHVTVQRQPALVCDVTQVARAVKLGDRQIVDARARDRFRGAVPEPRAGLASGHMPGARNLPFTDLLTPEGTLKDKAGLRAAFDAAGVDLARPVVSSCGSGVTAAVINLALERLGHGDHALYDGSWTEWGSFPDLPVATGEDRDV